MLVGPAVILAFCLQSRMLLLEDAMHRAERLATLLAEHGASTFDGYNLAFSRIDDYLKLSEAAPDESRLHTYLGDRKYIRHLNPHTTETGSEQDRGRRPIHGKEDLLVAAPLRHRLGGEVALVASRTHLYAEGRRQGTLVMVLC